MCILPQLKELPQIEEKDVYSAPSEVVSIDIKPEEIKELPSAVIEIPHTQEALAEQVPSDIDAFQIKTEQVESVSADIELPQIEEKDVYSAPTEVISIDIKPEEIKELPSAVIGVAHGEATTVYQSPGEVSVMEVTPKEIQELPSDAVELPLVEDKAPYSTPSEVISIELKPEKGTELPTAIIEIPHTQEVLAEQKPSDIDALVMKTEEIDSVSADIELPQIEEKDVYSAPSEVVSIDIKPEEIKELPSAVIGVSPGEETTVYQSPVEVSAMEVTPKEAQELPSDAVELPLVEDKAPYSTPSEITLIEVKPEKVTELSTATVEVSHKEEVIPFEVQVDIPDTYDKPKEISEAFTSPVELPQVEDRGLVSSPSEISSIDIQPSQVKEVSVTEVDIPHTDETSPVVAVEFIQPVQGKLHEVSIQQQSSAIPIEQESIEQRGTLTFEQSKPEEGITDIVDQHVSLQITPMEKHTIDVDSSEKAHPVSVTSYEIDDSRKKLDEKPEYPQSGTERVHDTDVVLGPSEFPIENERDMPVEELSDERECWEAPLLVQPLTSIGKDVGETVILKCQIGGSPQPIIHWLHNGGPIKGPRFTTLFEKDGRTVLVISPLKEDDNEFECIGTNDYGTVRTVIKIHAGKDVEVTEKQLVSTVLEVSRDDITAVETTMVRIDQPEVHVSRTKEVVLPEETQEITVLPHESAEPEGFTTAFEVSEHEEHTHAEIPSVTEVTITDDLSQEIKVMPSTAFEHTSKEISMPDYSPEDYAPHEVRPIEAVQMIEGVLEVPVRKGILSEELHGELASHTATPQTTEELQTVYPEILQRGERASVEGILEIDSLRPEQTEKLPTHKLEKLHTEEQVPVHGTTTFTLTPDELTKPEELPSPHPEASELINATPGDIVTVVVVPEKAEKEPSVAFESADSPVVTRVGEISQSVQPLSDIPQTEAVSPDAKPEEARASPMLVAEIPQMEDVTPYQTVIQPEEYESLPRDDVTVPMFEDRQQYELPSDVTMVVTPGKATEIEISAVQIPLIEQQQLDEPLVCLPHDERADRVHELESTTIQIPHIEEITSVETVSTLEKKDMPSDTAEEVADIGRISVDLSDASRGAAHVISDTCIVETGTTDQETTVTTTDREAALISEMPLEVSPTLKSEETVVELAAPVQDDFSINFVEKMSLPESQISEVTVMASEKPEYHDTAPEEFDLTLPLENAPVIIHKAPFIKQPLESTEKTVGETVILKCQIGGVPQPSIQWFHNGGPIEGPRFTTLFEKDGSTVLVISPLQEDDRLFECVGTNDFGKVTTAVKIHIEKKVDVTEVQTETTVTHLTKDEWIETETVPTVEEPLEVGVSEAEHLDIGETVQVTILPQKPYEGVTGAQISQIERDIASERPDTIELTITEGVSEVKKLSTAHELLREEQELPEEYVQTDIKPFEAQGLPTAVVEIPGEAESITKEVSHVLQPDDIKPHDGDDKETHPASADVSPLVPIGEASGLPPPTLESTLKEEKQLVQVPSSTAFEVMPEVAQELQTSVVEIPRVEETVAQMSHDAAVVEIVSKDAEEIETMGVSIPIVTDATLQASVADAVPVNEMTLSPIELPPGVAEISHREEQLPSESTEVISESGRSGKLQELPAVSVEVPLSQEITAHSIPGEETKEKPDQPSEFPTPLLPIAQEEMQTLYQVPPDISPIHAKAKEATDAIPSEAVILPGQRLAGISLQEDKLPSETTQVILEAGRSGELQELPVVSVEIPMAQEITAYSIPGDDAKDKPDQSSEEHPTTLHQVSQEEMQTLYQISPDIAPIRSKAEEAPDSTPSEVVIVPGQRELAELALSPEKAQQMPEISMMITPQEQREQVTEVTSESALEERESVTVPAQGTDSPKKHREEVSLDQPSALVSQEMVLGIQPGEKGVVSVEVVSKDVTTERESAIVELQKTLPEKKHREEVSLDVEGVRVPHEEITLQIDGPRELAPVEITLEGAPQTIEEVTVQKTTTTITKEVEELPEVIEIEVDDTEAQVTASRITEEIIREVTTEVKEGPVVIQELRSQDTVPGGIVYLECKFTGIPLPTFQWYHNGEKVRDERYVVINYNDGVSQLCITEVTPKDHGTFVCEATNPLGKATTVAEIRVYDESAKPDEKTTEKVEIVLAVEEEAPREIEIIISPPKFDQPIVDMEVTEGEDAKFVATVTGSQPITITWYEGTKPIQDSPEFKISFDGTTCILEVPEALPEDAATYTCKATNPAGEATCTAVLKVKGQCSTTLHFVIHLAQTIMLTSGA
ncbi:uncharacterized protein [Diadema antillarum]|uniref:uncharacterized protein n=1 Tax=Diadema antillarum TaxID=105358 RepID=UPI003A89252C